MAISKIKSESIDLTDTGYTFGDLLVSGDLTIDTNSLTVDSTNNRVGIGTTTPSSDLHVAKSGSGIIFQTERTDASGAFSISHTSQKTYLNTDQDYIFLMNGTEAMRINQSGELGIGTSDPQTNLHVAGSATILDVPNNGYSGLKISDDTSGDYNIYFDAGRNQAGTKFYFRDGGRVQGTSPWTDATPNTAAFISRGTNYFNGNVGIGTSSPTNKLHVQTGSAGGDPTLSQETVVFESSQNNYIVNLIPATASFSGFGFSTNTTNLTGGMFYSPSNNYMVFRTVGTERIRITSGGLVGIGTSSPQRNVHIHQPNANSSFIQLTNTSTGSASDSDGLRIGVDANSYAYIYQGENQHLAIGTNNTERMRLTSAGYLGIGTTSPSTLIDLAAGATGTAGGSIAGITMTNRFDSPDNSYSIKPNRPGVSNTGLSIRDETDSRTDMAFDGTGKVGIGTTSPTDLLDVRGSIKSRDASDNVGRFHSRNAFTVTNGTSVQLTSVCGSAIVCVSCNTTGAGGLFWGTFSTTVSKLAGDGLTSDSGTSDIAVYKSSSSNLMYFKNRSGFSRDYVITVYAARHA